MKVDVLDGTPPENITSRTTIDLLFGIVMDLNGSSRVL